MAVRHGGRAIRAVANHCTGVGGGGARNPVLCLSHQDKPLTRALVFDQSGGRLAPEGVTGGCKGAHGPLPAGGARATNLPLLRALMPCLLPAESDGGGHGPQLGEGARMVHGQGWLGADAPQLQRGRPSPLPARPPNPPTHPMPPHTPFTYRCRYQGQPSPGAGGT